MSRPKGKKSPQASLELKLEVIKKHYEENKTFRELEIIYPYSYATIRKWCLEFEIYGEKALISKTGRQSNKGPRTNNLDPNLKEIAILRKKLKDKEMEIEVLKKLNEFMEKLEKSK